ncbi:hypothetical protein COCON_G00140850 [Conger conger]|uniref:CIDE-N domain-containing protein n=1 Tax=Conger conger TaxID=82655 RepID=A0A9Q1DAQ4_CONCO|nr:hypothetical protein COCON_G00140850 [Conger conger]
MCIRTPGIPRSLFHVLGHAVSVESLGFDPATPVTVVLEDDGTIVADEAYFLCLPTHTKFMLLHERERWAPIAKIDGGTAWLTRESRVLEGDMVDSAFSSMEAWRDTASKLKQDLASIILLSEAELQSLVDVPGPELAKALGFREGKALKLQDTLQRVLDRREEERQSKELLQLYLKAAEKDNSRTPSQEGEEEPSQEGEDSTVETDGMVGAPSCVFSPRTLMVLKGKTSPETRLSNEELQMVVKEGVSSMGPVLRWDSERTSALLQACEEELEARLGKVSALRSLSAQSQQPGAKASGDNHPGEEIEAKRLKAPTPPAQTSTPSQTSPAVKPPPAPDAQSGP